MFHARPIIVVLATLAASVAVHAQVVAPAPGMPTNPYDRPREMDANDQLLNSPNDYLKRGVNDASVTAAADLAKMGGRARPAKAEDVKVGTPLLDKTGAAIGSIESVEADGAVVATVAGKVKVPLEAFGLNKRGLLVDLSKSEFDTLVAQANGK